MKIYELAKILNVLSASHPKGVSLFTLSKETDIELDKLRRYLAKYSDYFTQIPNTANYTANRFGKFKGDMDEMLKFHEEQLEAKSKRNSQMFFLYIAMFTSMIAIIVSGID